MVHTERHNKQTYLAKCKKLENVAENAKCTGKEKTLEKKRHQNFNASDLLASDTTGRKTWQNVNSKRRLQRIQNL